MLNHRTYSDYVKINLTSIGMIAKGLKSSAHSVTPERINSVCGNALSPACHILDVINVSAYEVENIAKLTFFQSRRVGGEYAISVYVAPNTNFLYARYAKMISLCNDVKLNLLKINAFIETLYSTQKLLASN